MSDVKNFLLNQKQPNGEGNLYEHLTNIMGKILLDNPKNAFDAFEDYSHEVKLTKYNLNDHDKFTHHTFFREQYSEIQAWATKARQNLNVRYFYFNFLIQNL